MMEDFRGFRRFPTIERRIGDILPEDGRVSFIGTIVDVGQGKIVVDDGSGSMEVLFENAGELATGKMVRVVGKLSDGLVSGEAVQDFSAFDMELYKKVKAEGKPI